MTRKTKNEWITAIVIAGIAGIITVVCLLLTSCSTQLQYNSIAKTAEPGDPCLECDHCTNCWTNTVDAPMDTNGVYLTIHQPIQQPGETPPVLVVTDAHNLTNGVHYYWQRSQDNMLEWIPLTDFVATTNFASRTNGIPNPSRNYYFRLRW